jgi:hypothetical protein
MTFDASQKGAAPSRVSTRRRVSLCHGAGWDDRQHSTARPGRGTTRRLLPAQRVTPHVKRQVRREQERKNDVTACAVLVANPMPDWSIEEILGVHFRMHKAEGVLSGSRRR